MWLAEQGLDVLALDFSPNALKKARALASERGVNLKTERADLEQWQWPTATFDVIVAIFIQFAGPSFRQQMFAGINDNISLTIAAAATMLIAISLVLMALVGWLQRRSGRGA